MGIQGYSRAHPVLRKNGILGNAEAYIGTIEAQGRGTLHLHMLLWLSGSPTTAQMQERLQRDDFRHKIEAFIASNIHADIAAAEGVDVLSVPKQPLTAFSRPIDPRQPNYEAKRDDFEVRAARTVQVCNGHYNRTPDLGR